jgi:glycosyltransferase involved in cell wall biosynthesis
MVSNLRYKIHNYLRRIYHRSPLPQKYKINLKNYYNNNFKFLTYAIPANEWQEMNHIAQSLQVDEFNGDDRQYINELFDRVAKKSEDYIPLTDAHLQLTPDDVKLIAFYLPQFHPIPENDKWWGAGFTEWTNVSKAVPQFCGHHQPHLPDELGFYDLRLLEIPQRQIELARQYGIYGFCYYYYWFNGQRLLEKPLQQVIDHPELDFPFCVCWANENWSRRWDGMEQDLLMEQHYSIEDDMAFIQSLVPLFKDSRYIRIGNKPALMVYRVGLLPDSKATAVRWREYCREVGIGEIYLISIKGLDFVSPQDCGFDAAAEFPPHTVTCPDITDQVKSANPNFAGTVYHLPAFVQSKTYLQKADYKLFKGVLPSWDNTARKPNNGVVFWGSSPELYKQWLTTVIEYTKDYHLPEERLVFINAWNEWAEGAHLEPDRKYGYAYLQATADAICQARTSKKIKKILCVSHDAHPHGAQILMRNMIEVLATHFQYEVHLFLKTGGRLEAEYAEFAHVYNLERDYPSSTELHDLVKSLHEQGVKIAICNTVVSGDLVKILSGHGLKTISLVHELPGIIRQYHIEQHAQELAGYAHKVVFPSTFVEGKFATITPISPEKVVISAQGLYAQIQAANKAEAKIKLRQRLNLPVEAKIALGVGYADLRKGIDLFIEIAKQSVDADQDIYFVWVGDLDVSLKDQIAEAVAVINRPQNLIFIPFQKEINEFYAGADVYLMTSREDPFPSVVLEAMAAATPVIGFADAGGFVDILTPETGAVVPYLDTNRMAEKLWEWMSSPDVLVELGQNGVALIKQKYKFLDYMYQLLSLLGHHYHKVSVVIPNYNYEQYLENRLQNIKEQTYPIYEMIILDDASTDNSQQIAQQFVDKHSNLAKLYLNKENSGSVFSQWARGISLAQGGYMWIAEADDIADPEFLEEAIIGFDKDNVILSYTQSRQMDEQGCILAPDYLEYTQDIDLKKWQNDYVKAGLQEITQALAVKNTIPNVSAVVFKKLDISAILSTLTSYKVAGDWYFYVWLLTQGDIAYRKASLNNHRRHSHSVTKQEKAESLLQEIIGMQDYIIANYPVDGTTRQKVYAYRIEVKEILFGKEWHPAN